jgi:hypothetical protein
MQRHLEALQLGIKPVLEELSRPRSGSRERHGHGHGKQIAGFKTLLSQWKVTYQDVSLTMQNLSRRIETAGREPTATQPQRPTPAPTPAPKRSDEMTIKIDQWAYLVEHVKNCWEEILDDSGRYLYENVYDKSLVQREQPKGAFIKQCPYVVSRPAPAPRPSFTRTQSYERTSAR